MYVCCATPSGGFGAFGGIITKGLGFTSFNGKSPAEARSQAGCGADLELIYLQPS